MIDDLVELALKERDRATRIFLQRFVTEQVEEEDSADKVIQKMRLMGDAAGGMFLLYGELVQRAFTPPSSTPAG